MPLPTQGATASADVLWLCCYLKLPALAMPLAVDSVWIVWSYSTNRGSLMQTHM